MLAKPRQWILLSLGWISLALGFIGVFLPVLPTTPFVILAAYFFSKGSKRLHQWILNQRLFGPLVRDWEANGIIKRKPKIYATSMIVLLFSYTLIFVPVALWIKAIILAIGAGVLTFIWTRPEEAPPARSAQADFSLTDQ